MRAVFCFVLIILSSRCRCCCCVWRFFTFYYCNDRQERRRVTVDRLDRFFIFYSHFHLEFSFDACVPSSSFLLFLFRIWTAWARSNWQTDGMVDGARCAHLYDTHLNFLLWLLLLLCLSSSWKEEVHKRVDWKSILHIHTHSPNARREDDT